MVKSRGGGGGGGGGGREREREEKSKREGRRGEERGEKGTLSSLQRANHKRQSQELPTYSSAVMKDMLEKLQAFSIQERITGPIKHKDDAVRHLSETSLPKEPS